jgi:flagellar hook-associated protein 2
LAVTVTGLFSGYDTGAIMDAVLAAAAVPRDAVQANIDDLETTSATLTEMSGKLNAISDLIGTLTDKDTLLSSTATLSKTGAFTATPDAGGAVPGTWTVEVTSLATQDNRVSQGFDDATSSGVVAQGTFSVTVNGETTSITVDGTNDSLTDFADALDAVDGVRAFVLDTGASTGRYKLVVLSEETGAANALEIDTSGMTGGGTVPAFTQTVVPTDAQITVNGVAVQSASNTIEAVPGLSLSLEAAGTGPVSITVQRDDAALTAKVQAFVDAYNDLVSFYGVNSNYDAANGISGALVGESGARRIMTSLQQKVSGTYATGGAFSGLSMIGISTNQDGTLSFDDAELGDALDSDIDSVVALFTSTTGPLATIQAQIDDVYVDSDNGILTSRLDSIEATVEQYEQRILVLDGNLAALEERLTLQFAALEETIAQLNSVTVMLDAMMTPGTSSKEKK